MAVNLPRAADVELLPALLQLEIEGDKWAALEREFVKRSTEEMWERTGMLGIPVGRVVAVEEAGCDVQGSHRDQNPVRVPFLVDGSVVTRRSTTSSDSASSANWGRNKPFVLELGSLWAAPLAGSLLNESGATVLKVETPRRPDGTRASKFFDLMNSGKLSIDLDLRATEDVVLLKDLLGLADVVIEAMRPSTFERLGILPELYANSGTVWVRMTGFGSSGPERHRVSFGDDAAVEGGAVVFHDDDRPRFLGDALADPVSGLVAALAALAGLAGGQGHVIDIAMREAVAFCLKGFGDTTDRKQPSGPPLRPSHRELRTTGPALGEHRDLVKEILDKGTARLV